ncbi:MAG: 3-phosphoshikimate 1-carboxyvinyltransferase [Actinomycetota bacterium]|nr:3-phosphoshikimate 1-carboxyvinyltransferase [Actinomycetota bacterium]
MTDFWSAPLAAAPVDATVALPGSKSMTNRALVLAATGEGPATIRHPLEARDTVLMADGLAALGTGIDRAGKTWSVRPGAWRGPSTVDVGNAGTVMRFLLVVATLADGPVRFDGDERARDRPLGPLIDALRSLGADIDDGDRGALPLTVHGGGGLVGGEVTVDATQSSQFVSALLLAAPLLDKGLRVRHDGPPVPSGPHIRMTVQMLRAAGVSVDDSVRSEWVVEPGRPIAPEWVVEPDLSNAAAFLAAGVVTGGRVRIPGWPARTTQAGAALPALFARMGADVSLDADGLLLQGTGTIGGLDADLHDVGELAPVLAAVCALATAPSRLHGIAHLRQHETDRLAALSTELNKLGGQVRETEDGLVIWPSPLHGGEFNTYDDHRLATAAAVLGLVVEGVQVLDIATTAKTLPDFPGMWERMLAGGTR